MQRLIDHFGGQDPWRLRPWEVAQPRDPYVAVALLREALITILSRQRVAGGHNSAWRQVRTPDVRMAENALSLIPPEMGRPPAFPDPRGDPVIAAAVCDLRDAARELLDASLTGFMDQAVIVKLAQHDQLRRALDRLVDVSRASQDGGT